MITSLQTQKTQTPLPPPLKWAGGKLAVVDCFGILDDTKIRRYFELGCEVKGLGRGHLARLKKEVLAKQG